MPAVLPPQVPVAVVEYIKNNNYVPNEFRNDPELYTSLFIREICILNNYKVFKNTYQFKNNRIPDNNKYCYLFLYSPKVVKCATKDETNSIIELLPELSPSGISPVVIDFVNKYGNAPKKYKNLDIFNADTYIHGPFIKDKEQFKDFFLYSLGKDNSRYKKDRCKIVLHNENIVRCATKEEYEEITITTGKFIK